MGHSLYMCMGGFAISRTKKVIGQCLPSNKKIHCMAAHALSTNKIHNFSIVAAYLRINTAVLLQAI